MRDMALPNKPLIAPLSPFPYLTRRARPPQGGRNAIFHPKSPLGRNSSLKCEKSGVPRHRQGKTMRPRFRQNGREAVPTTEGGDMDDPTKRAEEGPQLSRRGFVQGVA